MNVSQDFRRQTSLRRTVQCSSVTCRETLFYLRIIYFNFNN
ncbi:MAG: hypothetical protein ACTS5A_01525 [Candidatus Hodgkinia cicadicola]